MTTVNPPHATSVTRTTKGHFRVSNADHPPLRIGILLDGPELSAFFARIIEDIQRSNFARIELLVFRKKAAHAPAPKPQSRPGAIKHRLFTPNLRKRALYDAYLHFDHRMKPANHPLDVVDCSSIARRYRETRSRTDRQEIHSQVSARGAGENSRQGTRCHFAVRL